MSSDEMASPSVLDAVSTTDRPPCRSSPWWIFSCGGVNMKIAPMTRIVDRMRSQMLWRPSERRLRFLPERFAFAEVGRFVLVSLMGSHFFLQARPRACRMLRRMRCTHRPRTVGMVHNRIILLY